MPHKVFKSDAEWRRDLKPEQYSVLRQRDTERAFSGAYVNAKSDGTYTCAGCGAELFPSATKFDSGSGWPSFWAAVDETRIERRKDWDTRIPRIEITCSNCGGHLGHVFDDGPQPTGLRYCVNSAALDFIPAPPPPPAQTAVPS